MTNEMLGAQAMTDEQLVDKFDAFFDGCAFDDEVNEDDIDMLLG